LLRIRAQRFQDLRSNGLQANNQDSDILELVTLIYLVVIKFWLRVPICYFRVRRV
jgi:hypothetical protein